VQHAERIPTTFPWRAATLVVGAVAAAELVALIGIGAVRLAPTHAKAAPAAKPHVTRTVAHVATIAAPPSHPLRARTSVRVLILNGNGVQGAAATEAARLHASGYAIGGATNALRHDYAQSMVLYVPGWIKEARRLAHDTGIRLVAPIDGMHGAALKGAHVIVILGSS
jgi:hypothetical protein